MVLFTIHPGRTPVLEILDAVLASIAARAKTVEDLVRAGKPDVHGMTLTIARKLAYILSGRRTQHEAGTSGKTNLQRMSSTWSAKRSCLCGEQ